MQTPNKNKSIAKKPVNTIDNKLNNNVKSTVNKKVAIPNTIINDNELNTNTEILKNKKSVLKKINIIENKPDNNTEPVIKNSNVIKPVVENNIPVKLKPQNDELTGHIYSITSRTTKKIYIGQTNKNLKDRWQEHIHKIAVGVSKTPFADDVRLYGTDDLIFEHVDTFPRSELDKMEVHYIKEYNSLYPNGYNMMTGGKKNSQPVDLVREKISNGQFGNRRDKKDRIHDDEINLPKYILGVRESPENELLGYQVRAYPTCIKPKDYVSKKFMSLDLPLDQNLLIAKQCFNDFEIKYSEHKKKSTESRNEEYVLEKLDINLPPCLTEISKDGKIIGYKLKHKDIVKEFVEDKEQPHENLRSALIYNSGFDLNIKNEKFFERLKALPALSKLKTDPLTKGLPQNIAIDKRDGKILGFTINNFRLTQPDGSIKLMKKKFCDLNISMEEKYNSAISLLDEYKLEDIKNKKLIADKKEKKKEKDNENKDKVK